MMTTEVVTVSAYDRAVAALAEAKTVDDVLHVRNEAELLRTVARQAGNRDMIADAIEIQLKAERRLGAMLIAAKAAGQIGRGAGFQARNDDQTFQGGTLKVRLADAGIDRKLSMRAQQLAGKSDDVFAAALEQGRAKIVGGGGIVLNPLKDISTAGKKARRAEREVELAHKLMALPDKRYGVIYADPAWRFKVRSEAGMDRAADNHYPTTALEDIMALDVASIAADDCVLFLWGTAPMLPEALAVMAAWGFEYKSQIVWRKLYKGDGAGTGYWFRGMHEILLVGTRGDIPAPALGTQWGSVKPADVLEHSEKPDIFRQMIEQYFPTLPRIELNARRAYKGWDRWGLEAPADVVVTDVDPAIGPDFSVSGVASPAPAAIPPAVGAFKSTPATDAIIRAGYEAVPFDINAIAQQLGATKLQVRRRANQLGFGDRDRQREAMRKFNAERGNVGAA